MNLQDALTVTGKAINDDLELYYITWDNSIPAKLGFYLKSTHKLMEDLSHEAIVKNNYLPYYSSGVLCANRELIMDLKTHLGVDGERNGVEYCTVYDDEWPKVIELIRRKDNEM